MAEWKIIADECDLIEGNPVEVIINNKIILLIKTHSLVLGFDGLCPHQKARLVLGAVDGEWLHCPQHQAKFRLSDGLCGPGWVLPRLKKYQTKVDNGKVLILFDD